MTTASVGIYSRLYNAAGLTAVPVAPKVRATEEFPAITYNLIAAVPMNSLDGFSSFTRFIYQVDIWARTYNQALALALAARNAVIANNTPAFSALFIDRREEYDSELKIHNVQIDFAVSSTDD